MEREQQGWVSSLQRLGETLLSIIRNRVDLLAVEVQEEKQRVISTLVCASIAVFFGFISVIVITLTVVFLVPPDVRPYALLGFSVLYVVVAVWAGLAVRRKLRGRPPFSDTVTELRKDIAAWRSRP